MATYDELAILFGETRNTIDHTFRYIRANGFAGFARNGISVREIGYLSAFFIVKKVQKGDNEAAMDALISAVDSDNTNGIKYKIKQRVVPV